MSRGHLRIYLGAAPGVGKTFAMLNEGRRRAARGTDVVVGFVETHGRPATAAQLADLELLPRAVVSYRDTTMEELDLDALLTRRPDVALIDELAHTNVPGSRHEKRWEDVDAILDAGIDVITTVNIQHLESVNDVVETITGVRQRETIPDWVVRRADQVELVDMTPEALRRRMAHGNIYAPDKVDAALSNYFRVGNLSALREIALLWVADKVDDALQQYMEEHGIAGHWETRERVVVAVTGAPSGEHLIRRAARMAQRSHGELIGVHIRSGEGVAGRPSEALVAHQRLLTDLGGDYHEVVSDQVAEGLASFAKSVNATQMVLGSSRRSRWAELLQGSVINKAIRLAGDIDVHVISHDDTPGPALPSLVRRGRSAIPRRRQVAGWVIAGIGIPLLTALLLTQRDTVEVHTVLLIELLLVCVVAAVGGVRPALAAAVVSGLTANWFFTEPYSTLRIDDGEQLVGVVVFVVVGVLIGALVGQAARRSSEATRARAEAEALAGVAGRLSGATDPLPGMLSHLRITFGQDAVAVLARSADAPRGWNVEVSDGQPLPATPDDGASVELDDGLVLCLMPGNLSGHDRRVLTAFAAKLSDELERRSLAEAAASAAERNHADELRTAILRAVSHDLRTPLASIKASATSLLQEDVDWSPAHRREFAHTIDEEADRLDRLVGNLLDMSRIEAGAVEATTRAVGLEEVIASALASLSQPTTQVVVDIADDLPTAIADPGLFERVVANLVANALEHAPIDTSVRIEASSVGDQAVLRVVDRGPGIPPDNRPRAFDAFQRLDDRRTGGVGLGLAVAQGFMKAMDGELLIDDTPGGGLTVTLLLPRAAAGRPAAADEPSTVS